MPYKDNLRSLIIPSTLATGDNIVITGGQLGAGMGSIRVYQLDLAASAAIIVTPKSGATIVPGQIIFTAAGTQVLTNTDTPWMQTQPGQNLVLNLSVGGGVLSGTLWYSLA